MAPNGRNSVPADLEEVRDRIEHWRRTRTKRSPMPAELWEAAAGLARTHGVHPVARALGLNYDGLKRHVGGKRDGAETKKAKSQPAFVEIGGALPVADPVCVVELEDRRGEKMTIRLRSSEGLDVVGLAAKFWSRRR